MMKNQSTQCPKCGRPLKVWNACDYKVIQALPSPAGIRLFYYEKGTDELFSFQCVLYGVAEVYEYERKGHQETTGCFFFSQTLIPNSLGESYTTVIPLTMTDRGTFEPAVESSNFLGAFPEITSEAEIREECDFEIKRAR